CVALADPAGLVFTGAMLQVEDWIACLALRVVVRRQIDQCVPPRSRHFRVVPDLANRAVRHILHRIISRARLRHFYTTCWFASSKEGMSVGIADLRSINNQGVVVKAGNQRRGRDGPESILLFLHVQFRTAPKVQSDFCSIWSFHANLYSAGAVNPRILRCPDVGRRGLKIPCFLCTAKTRKKNNCDSEVSHLCRSY